MFFVDKNQDGKKIICNGYSIEERDKFLNVFINYMSISWRDSACKYPFETIHLCFQNYFQCNYKKEIANKEIINPSITTIKRFILDALREKGIIKEDEKVTITKELCRELSQYYCDFSKCKVLPVEDYRVYIMKLPKDCDVVALKKKIRKFALKSYLGIKLNPPDTLILILRADITEEKDLISMLDNKCKRLQ
jgi:hypothetical protein